MPDKIAPLPPRSVNKLPAVSPESLKLVIPWRSEFTSAGGKSLDPDSSFLAERGHLRRPHSI